MSTKLSIVGGGGLVGSCTAFALQNCGTVREIVLIDVNQDLAQGQALDLKHCGPLLADQIVRTGCARDYVDSDIICITAGLRRQPNESRLDLINRNTQLFRGILAEIQAVGTKPTAIVLVVSNPVDLLTQLATQTLDLPANQIIGLGTQLDTIRFRSILAGQLQVPPSQVSALVLGEHGDSMVPIWSSATIAGLPIDKFHNWSTQLASLALEQTKKSGAEVIRTKGGAGFAVGVAIADVVESIVLDQKRILPVSSLQFGKIAGIRDISLSVPTVVGRSGVADHLALSFWPVEENQLRASAHALRQTWQHMLNTSLR
ncbi:MAG TPA: lactate/malate dehydrogenase family protein [Pirellulaceae bacterium]|nr:lactate/malate dehydrogenase family protein [Pirellulaceae bacterium]HMO91442.1 lactate/malate dehydrogenase family protein [Pirellulaceae bacterium]HMP69481.1 lactate/malate dehydrogenase family protein [Pirellulaceae bacterium]